MINKGSQPSEKSIETKERMTSQRFLPLTPGRLFTLRPTAPRQLKMFYLKKKKEIIMNN